MTVDAPVLGNIDVPDDQDWYRFEVKSGRDLSSSTSKADPTGAGTLGNPYLRLLDSAGNEIAANGDTWWTGSLNSQIGYSAAADGLVYVSAQTEDGGTGSYRLSAHEVVGDVPDNTSTKVPLPLDTPVSGNIDFPNDQDWYRFETKAGTTYVFDLEGGATGAGTLGNPYLRLLDSAGNEIANNDNAGSNLNSQLGYSAAADGVVYVSAQTADVGTTGSYRLSAREIAGDVPGSTATSAELSVNAPVSGNIDFAFDEDWYRFEAKSGTTYVFDLEGNTERRRHAR